MWCDLDYTEGSIRNGPIIILKENNIKYVFIGLIPSISINVNFKEATTSTSND